MTMPPQDLRRIALLAAHEQGDEAAFVALYRGIATRCTGWRCSTRARRRTPPTPPRRLSCTSSSTRQYDPLLGTPRRVAVRGRAQHGAQGRGRTRGCDGSRGPRDRHRPPREEHIDATRARMHLRGETAEQVRSAHRAAAPALPDVLILCGSLRALYAEAAQVCGIDIGKTTVRRPVASALPPSQRVRLVSHPRLPPGVARPRVRATKESSR